MSQGLFRREVVEAKRIDWLGAIAIAQPPRLWMLAAAAFCATSAVLVYLICGTYTRRSTVVGQLVPSLGLATVLAPATGVVSQLNAVEGARVAIGQTIAVITIPRATPGNGDTVAAVERSLQQQQEGLDSAAEAQRRLLETQARGLGAQLVAARRELAQVQAEITTRQQQFRIANDSLQELRGLRESGYASLLQVRQQEAAVLEQTAGIQALQREALVARRVIAQLQQALRELPGQRLASEADFQRDSAALSRERIETDARSTLALAAPITGVVATQLVKPGQAVVAGQPLLSLVPGDGELEAELLVPSRAIGFVEPGDRVLLRYRAFPYQKFGHQVGAVASVSRSALDPGEVRVAALTANRSEPFYRVTVALARQAVTAYGKSEPLRPGMLLEADILSESRRLIEWLLEPLLAVSGRLGGS